MLAIKFPRLTILLLCKRRPLWVLGEFRAFFKETNGKNWVFCIEKEKREKTRMVNVVKSCHQVTWGQKT